MIYEKVKLNDTAWLEIYAADEIKGFTRKAILIIPGGGYNNICSDREGEPVAMAFMPYGFNAFVLHYSVGEGHVFPQQLIEASMAMKYIRDNTDRYNISSDDVFALGFSAGGHLAACLGTMWDSNIISDNVNVCNEYNKPKGVVLLYPVIEGGKEYSHNESFYNLFGTSELTEDEYNSSNIINYISEKTPPTFIMHSSNDELVNVKNSLMLADKFAENNIKFEMHIYYDAPHGVALANKLTWIDNPKYDNNSIAKWVECAVMWIEQVSNEL